MVIETCTKHPGGPTRIRVTEISGRNSFFYVKSSYLIELCVGVGCLGHPRGPTQMREAGVTVQPNERGDGAGMAVGSWPFNV